MSHFFAIALVEPKIAQRGARAILDKIDRVMALHTATLAQPGTARALWDGRHVGGRYDGIITRDRGIVGQESPTVETQGELLRRNMCPVRDLPDDIVPFAVITPDGQYHVEGAMGPFGYSHDLDPYWEDRYDGLRELYAECVAVGLDCHT